MCNTIAENPVRVSLYSATENELDTIILNQVLNNSFKLLDRIGKLIHDKSYHDAFMFSIECAEILAKAIGHCDYNSPIRLELKSLANDLVQWAEQFAFWNESGKRGKEPNFDLRKSVYNVKSCMVEM